MSEKNSDQLGKRFRTITGDLKLYIEKRIELLLLNIGEQYSQWMAESIQKLTGIFLLFGAFVFVLVAVAIYLGELLGWPGLGYVIVSIPLFVTGLFFFYLKPRSLAENLQQHFESELIKALTQNVEQDGKKHNEPLNLPESTEEKVN
ncbi:hypothetical protein G3570_05430 [Balneolaceae bacterium YR4-1]|uniref:Holin-X, holin superfamily III n=1 Tax=Halalkalibaculum roseum TaxID=2709311 RepID=A0A6M1SL64_9BACT|nr:phage holin family protein [Halalkalibaculum roseum]NGP76061.1 hypothetical protein [Halalkalibaculum roseum]